MSIAPKPRRKRRYLAAVGVSSLATAAAPLSLARAAVPFGSEPLAGERVIALAQPLSGDRWTLIVLEQREPAPPCWRRNANGSVLTYEMHLPESTCGRYLSSSSYSLRVGGQDLRQPWRLRVESTNGQLQLLASGDQQGDPLLIGSGRAVGSSLVELKLHDDWSFERRSFQGQNLSHLYVAHATPLPVLLAQVRNGGGALLAAPPAPPPPLAPEPRPATVAAAPRTPAPAAAAAAVAPPVSSSASRLARLESLRLGGPRAAGPANAAPQESSGVIALQVVPYRP